MKLNKLILSLVWFIGLGFGATSAVAQAADKATAPVPSLLPRDREIELALSAGPEYIRQDATVYVLEKNGYVKVREGTNGFTSLVLRDGHHGLAPICYDAEGSQTTLLADFREAELRMQGKSLKDVAKEIAEGYRTGKFSAPRKPGIAYMLSTENDLDDPRSGKTFRYPPHVMLYAPYMKNSDIGAAPKTRGSVTEPWVLHEGEPNAYIIVVTRER